MRISLAVFAALALLTVGAVVALAAPGALGRAASPSGGAADAVYCPAGLVKQLKAGVNTYRKRMVADRTRYFRAHKSTKQRAAFVRLQSQQLNSLQKRLAKCS
jgi:hypothetical protein